MPPSWRIAQMETMRAMEEVRQRRMGGAVCVVGIGSAEITCGGGLSWLSEWEMACELPGAKAPFFLLVYETQG